MNKMSWADIFVNVAEFDFQSLLSQWPQTISGRLQPIGGG
jgi:hypothetical protein